MELQHSKTHLAPLWEVWEVSQKKTWDVTEDDFFPMELRFQMFYTVDMTVIPLMENVDFQ